MSLLTTLTPLPRKPGRYSVTLGDGGEFVLSLTAIERLGLVVGMGVDAGLRGRIEREAAVQRAIDRGIALLAHRGRSERELRRRLQRDGLDAEAIDAGLAHLTTLGYLNDGEYARQVARAKMLGPGHSATRVRAELARRGVARPVVDAALDEVRASGEVDEEAMLERVARKKLRTLADLDPAARRRRLFGFLARRGFPSDAIVPMLERLERESDPGDDSAADLPPWTGEEGDELP